MEHSSSELGGATGPEVLNQFTLIDPNFRSCRAT